MDFLFIEKLVTNKKAEVDAIRETFNIQNDNPVCFLNQETSKHFLNSSDRAQKYQYFMKASQIESIKKIQETIDETRRNALKMIEDKSRAMPKMEEDLYNLEVKYKKVDFLVKLGMTLYFWWCFEKLTIFYMLKKV